MAHDYIAIATCKYYDDSLDNLETETIVITEIETFAEAMAKIESYYGDDLEFRNYYFVRWPLLFYDS